jgi:hypothetical protein
MAEPLTLQWNIDRVDTSDRSDVLIEQRVFRVINARNDSEIRILCCQRDDSAAHTASGSMNRKLNVIAHTTNVAGSDWD